MKYFWFLSPTQLFIQGQWWSILLMQCLQILQWCARGGLYISHLNTIDYNMILIKSFILDFLAASPRANCPVFFRGYAATVTVTV